MKALITGVSGQTAWYLADELLTNFPNIKVYGMVRRSSRELPERLNSLIQRGMELVYGDLQDGASISSLIDTIRPQYLYNLAAMSHVGMSFKFPEVSMDVNGTGTIRLLEAVRSKYSQEELANFRFYQASTSELFGSADAPQSLNTPLHPNSPYAVAKLAAYWSTVIYRRAYGMHCSNGILNNHESKYRSPQFVTRKITLSAARILTGVQNILPLGNISAIRDWTHARDMARAMIRIVNMPEGSDYMLGSGKGRSVEEFLITAFKLLGVNILPLRAAGIYTIDSLNPEQSVVPNIDYSKLTEKDIKAVVVIDQAAAKRPLEVPVLTADCKESQERLRWTPIISFEEMIKEMLISDYEIALKEAASGFSIPLGQENKYYA